MFHSHAPLSLAVMPLEALTIDALTLEERSDLERAVDGPITPAMIADKLRGRALPVVEDGASAPYLRALLIWARADLKFYRKQIADLETDIAELIADRDGIYGASEKDRKTRHIAALTRQRDTLIRNCGPYHMILLDAANKLATLQGATRE